MGLADWFSTFCGNLQISDGGTISSRYKAITRRLNKDFWDTESETCHSLYVGICPRNDESAGKRRSIRLRQGAPWLKPTLVQAAWSATRGWRIPEIMQR